MSMIDTIVLVGSILAFVATIGLGVAIQNS